jgi:hypothetical protein
MALGANPHNGRLGREQLLQLLQSAGEPMDASELLEALQLLTGAHKLSEAMPHNVDSQKFSTEVLGFEADVVAQA